ncbi:hypothetical protein MMC25_000464, partial [Agyrium rufum]|nr:hypothetical protein [Agyrium rufum]
DTSRVLANSNTTSIGRPVLHSRQPSTTAKPSTEAAIGKSANAAFPPTFNFDDFQTNLRAEDLALGYHTEISATSREQAANPTETTNKVKSASSQARKTSQPVIEPRISRNNSLVQRKSSLVKKKIEEQPTKDLSMGPPVAPINPRSTRRQSHFPTAKPPISSTRTSRKSVGPGILTSNGGNGIFGNVSNIRQTTLDGSADVEGMSQGDVNGKHTFIPSQTASFTGSPRSNKAKSMQPSMKSPQDYLSMPFLGSEHTGANGIGINGSPAAGHTNTPTSGNKRLSMMPGHATGLGARTISPTDARRLKRLSMRQIAPPVPSTPPSTQAEFTPPNARSRASSPTHIPRKVVTPSSSRNTPDPLRKSLVSAPSASSGYASHRASSGSFKMPVNLANTRLPTARSKTDTTSAEPDVPPVPAIPKAYESPKYEHDVPFFGTRKSSLPFDTSSLNSTSTADVTSVHSSDKDNSKTNKGLCQASKVVAERPVQSSKPVSIPNSQRSNPSARLPPINLLPLSTPTAAKIAALQDNNRHPQTTGAPITPPPRRGPPKTPSTPMTASKASFFPRYYHKEDTNTANPQIRSSSSHYALRSETSSFRAPSSSSSSVWAPAESHNGRKAISPFLSSSLPKASLDLSFGKDRSVDNRATVTGGGDLRPTRLTGPRAPVTGKLTKSNSHETDLGLEPSPQSTESNTSSFGASIRRTLSLTRRRSASKTQSHVETTPGPMPQPPRHHEMPPPKLPASATWNSFSNVANGPKSQHLHAGRKPSVSDIAAKNAEASAANASIRKLSRSSSDYSLHPVSSSTLDSFPTPVVKKAPKVQSIDTQLDDDDLVAESEMMKFATKRKDTESAARELDELRRRATGKDRITPSQALRTPRYNLNIFERGEILDFKEVYFCGIPNAKKFTGDLKAETANFGYDDERGDYNIVEGDHLAYRYEVIDVLGKGSFGQVVRCIDHKTGGLVAVKIIRNKKRFHQQALVEVDILQKLREWDPANKFSMVSFTQSFYFRGHLCISTELLGMNLYEFIKAHDFRGFSLKLIRRFTKQMLNSLVLLKSHKVIHCDLKPENILLAHPAHSEIKVIDFGSSCLENEKVYTYIQSRFYRSPEVILGMSYGLPIDMWSLGCILAELLTGYPIFPGENEQEQLACIMEIFGPPDKHLIEKSTRKKLFFDSLGKPRLTVSTKGKRRRPSTKTLQQALKCDDEIFLDFIKRCLRWDPERRLKPDEAIHHEFITGIKPSSVRNFRGVPSLAANASVNSSPVKRISSQTTPSAVVRPLPEPPTTSIKNSTAASARARDGNGGSPVKQAMKRHSTVNGPMLTMTRKSQLTNGTSGPASSLPRLGPIAAPRSASGKPDLATAVAATAVR